MTMEPVLGLVVRTFECGTEKEAARKPAEEAMEAYAAWELLGRGDATLDDLDDLADELADCVTACCNLAARHGIDLQAAIQRVEERNRERGRYGEAV